MIALQGRPFTIPNADPCWFVNHWQIVASKIPCCGYPLEMQKVFFHMYFPLFNVLYPNQSPDV